MKKGLANLCGRMKIAKMAHASHGQVTKWEIPIISLKRIESLKSFLEI
jgi:hypothetical protein